MYNPFLQTTTCQTHLLHADMPMPMPILPLTVAAGAPYYEIICKGREIPRLHKYPYCKKWHFWALFLAYNDTHKYSGDSFLADTRKEWSVWGRVGGTKMAAGISSVQKLA